jgi:hypothetical protein
MPIPFADLIARVRRRLAEERTARQARALAPVAVFLIALAQRVSFLGEHPLDAYLVSDMAFFDARARDLLSGDLSLRDTFTPAGYPALVALAHAWSGAPYAVVGYAQALLGAGTAVLTWAIALRLTRSAGAAFAAGLAVAFYLPLIVYGGFLLTETLFAFLLALFVCLASRAVERPGLLRTASAGLVLGFAATVRPNLLLAFPLLAAYALHLRRASAPSPGPRAWLVPLSALAFALPVIGAAAAHNSRIAGRPAGVATNGGINFLLGHCECRAVTFPRGTGVREVSGYQNRKRYTGVIASDRPAYDEAHYYRLALRRIADQPALVVRALVNVGDGLVLTDLGEWPAQPYYPGWMGHEDELRAFGRGFAWVAVLPAFAHAAWLGLRRRVAGARPEPARGLAQVLVGSMLATLYIYLGDPRMRVPFDPLLIALAASAWLSAARACRRATGRSGGREQDRGDAQSAPDR